MADDGGALAGLRVVEYAQGIAGPFCGKAFADLGADVLKVEPPAGDRSRADGPFPGDRPDRERSARFLYLNTNKRGAVVDVREEAGRERLRALAAGADLFIADLAPAAYAEPGLDHETLRGRNPGLIMTCISPHGLDGPYRDYTGSAFTAFHGGGMGRETPYNEIIDTEAFPPLVDGGSQGDYLTGWTAATLSLIAVFHRAATGRGQLVDVSAMEAVAAMTRMPVAAIAYGQEPKITREKANFPWVMPCKDGHVSFAPFLLDHWWRAVVEMMGSPDWATSEAFATTMGRVANADVVEPLTVEWLMEHTKQEVYEMALSRNVACFPVNTMAEVLDSRQYAARGSFVDVEHPRAGTLRQPGSPAIWSDTPWKVRRPAPLLGEHTDEALAEATARPAPATDGGSGKRLPLEGVRVADFGWILAGPYATAWLGSLGAEVIRVESQSRLDFHRQNLGAGADGVPGINRGAVFNSLNFSRKSVRLNLATPRGLELAKELVRHSDIVMENYAAGVMEKMGLGYEALRAVNPGVIMVATSPLGQTGPDRAATGWGPNVQAYAGLPHLTGYEGGPPSGLGGLYPDFMIGTVMAFTALAALHARGRTGEGQYVDLSMAQIVSAMIPEAIMDFAMNGREPERPGNRSPAHAPRGVYRCAGDDQWVAIEVADGEAWRALAETIGEPAWARDAGLAGAEGRRARHDAIDARITAWTRERTHLDAMHALQAAGVSAAACLNPYELLADPAMRARDLYVEMDHPEVGPRLLAGLPGRYGELAYSYGPAPLFGQHGEEVCRDLLGLDAAEYERLVAGQVIW